jgi:hypothetical protein
MPGGSAFTPSQLTRVTLLENAIRFTLISAPPARPKLRLRVNPERSDSAPGMQTFVYLAEVVEQPLFTRPKGKSLKPNHLRRQISTKLLPLVGLAAYGFTTRRTPSRACCYNKANRSPMRVAS